MFAFALASNTCSQTTNIDDLILGLLFPGCPGKLAERFGEEVRRDRNNPGNQILQDWHTINKKKEYIIGELLPIIHSQQKYQIFICFDVFSAYYNNNSSISPSKNNSTESHILLEPIQIPPAINRIFLHSQNTALCKINKAYLWPRSKGWMRALLREHSTCSD